MFDTLSSENETVMCGISGVEVTESWETYYLLHVGGQQCALYKSPIWSVRNWLANDQVSNDCVAPRILWPDTVALRSDLTAMRTRPRWLLVNTGGAEDMFVFGSRSLQKRLHREVEAYEVNGLPVGLEDGVVIESRNDTPLPVRLLQLVLDFAAHALGQR